jgi:hypothetical protein
LKELFKELHEELKGTRTVNGELKIEGYTRENYEDLYDYLIEFLQPVFHENYWNWYERTCRSYIRFRKANSKSYDIFIPQVKNVYEHTLGEQLAVLRFYIYRRTHSNY